MDKTYVPKNGARFSAEDASILGAYFERIANDGALSPEDVVDAARGESSPLHDFFEWNDAVAGEAFRRDQARYYLRNIEVIRKPEQAPMRAFHVVTIRLGDNLCERGFVGIDHIIQERELLAQVIEDEKRRLIGCRARLSQYEALVPEALGALTLAIESLTV